MAQWLFVYFVLALIELGSLEQESGGPYPAGGEPPIELVEGIGGAGGDQFVSVPPIPTATAVRPPN